MAFRDYPRTRPPLMAAALPMASLLLLGLASCANTARRYRLRWGEAVNGVRIEIVGVPEASTTADPVEIRFRITNSGKRAIHFVRRRVPYLIRFGHPEWSRYPSSAPIPLLVDPGGKQMRPRLIPPYGDGGSLEVKPGQTHRDVIDLTHIYVLTEPGKYQVHMALPSYVRSFWTRKVKRGPIVLSRRHTFDLAQAPVEVSVGRGLERLASPKWVIRNIAATVLGEVRSPEAVPALIRALDDDSAYVRGSAARALGKIGSKEAVAALMRSLTATPLEVRRGAAYGLGYARDPAAVPRLMEVFTASGDFIVRGNIVWALGEIGDRRATAMLLKVLEDPDSDVRRGAVRALGKIGDRRATTVLLREIEDPDSDVRHWAAEALGEIGDRRATTMLLKEFEDPDSDVRRRAVDALGAIKDERAVGPLLREVEEVRERKYGRDSSAFFEYAVMRALANIGAPEAIDPIIALLGHKHASVRSSTAKALGLFGGDRAVEALTVALNDDDSRVRQYAAGSLGKIGDSRAVRPLVRAMGDESEEVRAVAVTALGKIGGAEAKQVVGAAIDDKSYDVRCAAEAALGRINTAPHMKEYRPLCGWRFY